MAEFIPPMLATLVDAPFDDDNWLFEVKWDGFRALAYISEGKAYLKSRNKLLFNSKFPSIVKQLLKVQGSVIFDGEIVSVDSKGKSHFQWIQNYKEEGPGTLCYYVFDLLYKDGQDLRSLPLIERKSILKKYLKELSLPLIRYSDHILGEGEAFFKAAEKEHLEGIIGKEIVSVYESRRSRHWVKIKTSLRQEVIICGMTEPKGARKKFGALIAGIYNENRELVYAGNVGGGFTVKSLHEVFDRLKPLIQKKCPFKTDPHVDTSVTWVKPLLMCEVVFSEWTKGNRMRQPIFQGMREDKNVKTVKKEMPIRAPIEREHVQTTVKGVALTHLDKIYWPKEKYTKGDLVAYYEKIAPYILPYLKNRPIILHRMPNGIEEKGFYQKDINFSLPDWVKTFPVQHEGKIDRYLLINDLRSLLFAVNLGSIDLHPFHARITGLDKPDYCVIDLDPHDIAFEKVIETALLIHDILTEIKIRHYCKTSGGKGLHILIPLHAKYDYEQSRQFAEVLCHLIHKQLPKTTSMERSPEKRPNRIYLDCLQNRKGQSIVAPYAVRPRPKAMVSTPLMWEEVNRDLILSDYTIETIPNRLKTIGDIFKPVLETGIDMKAGIARLHHLI